MQAFRKIESEAFHLLLATNYLLPPLSYPQKTFLRFSTAPEFALVYKLNPEWQFRGRVATGYGTPQVGNLFVLSNGQNGNNTQLTTQQNLGNDLGF